MASQLLYSNGPLRPFEALEDGEEVLHSLDSVACSVRRAAVDEDDRRDDAAEDWGSGRLRVTTRRVIWEGASWAFALATRLVGLHAVARDEVPGPCLYAQILLDDFPPSDHPAELFFVPADAHALPDLFDAFSRSAALNPDDASDADAIVGSVAPDAADDAAAAMLQRFDDMLTVSPALGQFDDAPDDHDAPQ
mmetsp:Transcript_13356/g.40411  ORF Transcript_13356/g.40411 Transcript_13356/m.40411 type:complete len:193 (-) Transcript_13356:75-653(-)